MSETGRELVRPAGRRGVQRRDVRRLAARDGIVRISALSQAASEEGYRRAAVERGPGSFDARRFIECAELVENRARLHEKLTGRREVSGDLAQ